MNDKRLLLLNDIKLSYCDVNNCQLDIIDNISFSLYENEIISLIGPSGCGKSSLLRIVSGEEKNYTGICDCNFSNAENNMCNCGFLYQDAACFDWMTVKQNVEFGLKMRKMNKKEREIIAKKYIDSVGLSGFENYYPGDLSGGMKQRVSLARLLVLNPKLLLMDEPFAALDAMLRKKMQQLTMKLCKKYGQSIIFVTHDIDEAITVADRIYVLSKRPTQVLKEIKVPKVLKETDGYENDFAFNKLKMEIMNYIDESTEVYKKCIAENCCDVRSNIG